MPVVKNAQIRFRIIDRCIRNQYKPFPSKEELRQACEDNLFGSTHGEHISDSTIEKDLFAMRMEHDAPIKYSKRDLGYFYEDENYSLENIPLTEDDVDAIKFAANIFDKFKGVAVFKQFEFAIDKILDRVNISSNIEDEAVNEYVQFETAPSNIGSEHLQPLLLAIKEKKICKFGYKSFKSGKEVKWKERTVHPYLLKEFRNRWYLIGYSEAKEKVITYGLDRMKNVSMTDKQFQEESSFNPDDYFSYSIGITTAEGEKPEKIEIEVNEVLLKYLTSQPLHSSQKKAKSKDGTSILKYTIHPTHELDMAILSFGDQAKVIAPKTYVKHISKVVSNMKKMYK